MCQDNCVYLGYNNSLEKIDCNCLQKTTIQNENVSNIEKIINVNEKFSLVELKERTKNVFKNSNLRIIKCYYKIFDDNIDNNAGFICLTIVLVLNFIGLILFYIYDIKKLKVLFVGISNPPKKIEKNLIQNEVKIEDYSSNKLSLNLSNKLSLNKINNKEENVEKELNEKENNIETYSNFYSDKNKEYNNDELNEMDYEDALINDKRSYFKYYFSRLKYCHILIFTFYTKDDNNVLILKISLLLNQISLLLTVKSLFFNDNSMTHVYRKKGKFDFIYEIPKIILSTLISVVICFLMKFLCLTHDQIFDLKNIEEENKLKEKSNSKFKCFHVKIIIFYGLLIALNIFYIYYISIFCSVK